MEWQRLRSLRVNDDPQSFQLNTQGAPRLRTEARPKTTDGSRSGSTARKARLGHSQSWQSRRRIGTDGSHLDRTAKPEEATSGHVGHATHGYRLCPRRRFKFRDHLSVWKHFYIGRDRL